MYSDIKTFQQLREYIWEEKQSSIECFIERVSELNEFETGRWKGEIDAYDQVLHLLRNIDKYGEDLNEIEVSLSSSHEIE